MTSGVCSCGWATDPNRARKLHAPTCPARKQLTHEGIECVTIEHSYGGSWAVAGRYRIRRADGSTEFRVGPEGLAGDVMVRLIRLDWTTPDGRVLCVRVMETNS